MAKTKKTSKKKSEKKEIDKEVLKKLLKEKKEPDEEEEQEEEKEDSHEQARIFENQEKVTETPTQAKTPSLDETFSQQTKPRDLSLEESLQDVENGKKDNKEQELYNTVNYESNSEKGKYQSNTADISQPIRQINNSLRVESAGEIKMRTPGADLQTFANAEIIKYTSQDESRNYLPNLEERQNNEKEKQGNSWFKFDRRQEVKYKTQG